MSADSQWDPRAALRNAAVASALAPSFRSEWTHDVQTCLPDRTGLFDLGREVDRWVMRNVRLQVINSFNEVISLSGLCALSVSDTNAVRWYVSCTPDESNRYHWDPFLNAAFLTCTASINGRYEVEVPGGETQEGLLSEVQLSITSRAPVQNWATATEHQLNSAIARDMGMRPEPWRSMSRATTSRITKQILNTLLDNKDDAWDTWEADAGVSLEEARMCVSARIDATLKGRDSLRVDATYRGWYWGDDEPEPLQPVDFSVACSKQPSGLWKVA